MLLNYLIKNDTITEVSKVKENIAQINKTKIIVAKNE